MRPERDGDDDDSGLHCVVQYDFVPRTPPTSVSALATGSASILPPSPSLSLSAFSVGTSTMIMTPPTDYEPHRSPAHNPDHHTPRSELPRMAVSQQIPLSIQIRKWRVLFATIVLVGLLLLCVRKLHNGVVVYHGTQHDDRKELWSKADSLNFYFGTVATMVATVFEIAATFVVPIVVLVLLTETSMLNDSFYWVVGFVIVQGIFVSLLSNAFHTTYVASPEDVVTIMRMVETDLFQSPSTAAQGLGEIQSSSTTMSIPRRASTETMLRTAMLPPYVRPTKATCMNGDNSKAFAMSFGFAANGWLRRVASEGIPLAHSYNFSVSDWLSTTPQARPSPALPFSTTTSANLAIHAMRLLFDRVRVPLFSVSTVNPLDVYVSRARTAQAKNDSRSFVLATAQMLNETLSPMAPSGFFFAAEQAVVQFSSLQLNKLVDFQAITILLPFKPRTIQRAISVTQFETLRDDKSFDPLIDGDLIDANGDLVYQIFPEAECGQRGCWLMKANRSQEDDDAWSIRPEIVAYSRCKQTLDAIGASDLGFVACVERDIVNDSIAIGAIGSSLHADRLVEYAGPGHSATSRPVRRANITNLRRSLSITIGFLSWRFTDLTRLSPRASYCNASSCEGLYYVLNGDTTEIVLLGKDHIVADGLYPIGSTINAGQPLASAVTNLPPGAFLPLRNIKNVTRQVRPSAPELVDAADLSWPCSRDIDFIADSIEHNHWYIDHGLQEAYTAGLFHLFQFGVNHSVSVRLWEGQYVSHIDLHGNVLEFDFLIRIPSSAATVSVLTGFFFLASVAAVLLASKRRECTMREVLDVHRVARVHLVERFFPKIFLKSTVYDTPQGRSFAPFRIVAMKLHHETPEGDVFVTLPAPPRDGRDLEQGFAFRPLDLNARAQDWVEPSP